MPNQIADSAKEAQDRLAKLNTKMEGQGGKADESDVKELKAIRDLLSPAPAAAAPAAPTPVPAPAPGSYPAPQAKAAEPPPPPAPHVWEKDLAAAVMADKAKGK